MVKVGEQGVGWSFSGELVANQKKKDVFTVLLHLRVSIGNPLDGVGVVVAVNWFRSRFGPVGEVDLLEAEWELSKMEGESHAIIS